MLAGAEEYGRVRADEQDLVLTPPAAGGHVRVPSLRVQLEVEGTSNAAQYTDIHMDSSGDCFISTSSSTNKVKINNRDVLAEVDSLKADFRLEIDGLKRELQTVHRLLSAEQRALTGFDPLPERYKLIPLPPSSTANGLYRGAVEAIDGRIFFVPRLADHVLVLDPFSETFDIMFEGALPAGTDKKWTSGVRVPDGRIFFLPGSETSVLIIDPVAGTMDNTSLAGLPSSPDKWHAAALGQNGIVVGIPYQNVGVVFMDPVQMTVDTTSITFSDLGGAGWQSASTADNGIIYACPRSAADVLAVNPVTKTFFKVAIPSEPSFTTTAKFVGSVFSSGSIYCTPFASDLILVLDTRTNGTSTIALTHTPSSIMYAGPGAVSYSGHIFLPAFGSPSIAIIDTATNSLNDTALASFDVGGTSQKFNGALHGTRSTGLIYMIPWFADFVLAIYP